MILNLKGIIRSSQLNSKLFESTWEKEIKTDGKNRFLYEILKFSYNKFYQGPLSWQTFGITTLLLMKVTLNI